MLTKSIIIASKRLSSCEDYKLHGKFIGWYGNGNKWFEWGYKNGKLHGKHIEWNSNSNKMYELEYKNGKRIG